MTRLRTLGRWLGDWRNGAVFAACILVASVAFVIVDASQGRHDAFEALQRQTRQQGEAREAATRRIDLLQARIDELVGKGEANAAVLGQLVGEVEALRAQVRAMGGDPVVDDRTQVTSGPAPRSAPTTQRSTPAPTTTAAPPPPTPSPQPAPTTTTTTRPGGGVPCDAVFVPVLCAEPTTTRRSRP